MGYRNVWEIRVRTECGSIIRWVGKKALINKYTEWLMSLAEVKAVEVRQLTNEERIQIPFNSIVG